MFKTFPSTVFVSAAMACTLLVACGSTAALSSPSKPSPLIGWLHGGCIALESADVAVGSAVVLVSLDGPRQALTQARISGRAEDAKGCPALLEDRQAVNRANGLSFYRVEPVPGTELAIGVLSGHPEFIDTDTMIDTNGDGRPDTFSQCSTAEGVQFSVWANEVGQGEPLWRGYYYLGYDVEADCPDAS